MIRGCYIKYMKEKHIEKIKWRLSYAPKAFNSNSSFPAEEDSDDGTTT